MNTSTTVRRQQGFGLIEILVGVVIGVVGILIMFQTLAVWEGRNRTASTGNDAQVTGSLAMFSLERDLMLAGLGFGSAPAAVMGCNVAATDTLGGVERLFNFNLVPVEIVLDAGGGPDRIRVLYGNSAYLNVTSGDPRNFVSATAFTTTLDETRTRIGFHAGDLAIMANTAVAPAPCAMVQVTDEGGGRTFAHANGNYQNFYQGAAAPAIPSRFNAGVGAGAAFVSGPVFNLGPDPRRNEWRVNGRVLMVSDVIHNTADFEVAEDVIDLRAQYGVDVNPAAGVTTIAWGTAAPADWTQVRAVRVAMLVRGKQFERPAVEGGNCITTVAPAWAAGAFLMRNVDGSADAFGATDAVPNNWRCYRYRVDEKVIPLRNMIWGTAP
jgi:type IV pilus assembly protein PilW